MRNTFLRGFTVVCILGVLDCALPHASVGQPSDCRDLPCKNEHCVDIAANPNRPWYTIESWPGKGIAMIKNHCTVPLQVRRGGNADDIQQRLDPYEHVAFSAAGKPVEIKNKDGKNIPCVVSVRSIPDAGPGDDDCPLFYDRFLRHGNAGKVLDWEQVAGPFEKKVRVTVSNMCGTAIYAKLGQHGSEQPVAPRTTLPLNTDKQVWVGNRDAEQSCYAVVGIGPTP